MQGVPGVSGVSRGAIIRERTRSILATPNLAARDEPPARKRFERTTAVRPPGAAVNPDNAVREYYRDWLRNSWRLVGAPNLDLADAGLINAGFESGDASGWRRVGVNRR